MVWGLKQNRTRLKSILWEGYLSTAKKLLVDKGILRKVAMALICLTVTGLSSHSDNPSDNILENLVTRTDLYLGKIPHWLFVERKRWIM